MMISRGENAVGLDYRPLKPKSISSVVENGDDGEKWAHVPKEDKYTPLPRTMIEYLKVKDKYISHPIWDLCSPCEFYKWTKDWDWTAEYGHQPIVGVDPKY